MNWQSPLIQNPDQWAIQAFIAGEINSREWNERVLPACQTYVASWLTEDPVGENRCRQTLRRVIRTAIQDSLPPEPQFPGWQVSDDLSWGKRVEPHFECYFAEWRGDYWVSIYSGSARIMHLAFNTYARAIDFVNQFLEGELLTGVCMDSSHTVKRKTAREALPPA